MYCKNCGRELNTDSAVCLKCGFAVGTGTSFCQNCGAAVTPGAAVCTNCGAAIMPSVRTGTVPGANLKSKVTAGLLGIFLGRFGIHNFYLGYKVKGIIQLLITVLTCGFGAVVSEIWGFVEGILILTGSIKTDGAGNPLT